MNASVAPVLSVLLVDDDAELRRTLAEMLSGRGHRVRAVENGREALAAAREAVPDVIVTDVSMPVMDGFALVAALRADPAVEAVSVVYLTGKADRDDVRRGMGLGGDDYLTKPCSAEELIAAVEVRALRRLSMERRAEAQLSELRSSVRRSLSHELLTPLNAVIGFASLLEENAGTIRRAQLAEWGSLIRRSGERQLALVRKVLAHADAELCAADPARRAALHHARTSHARPAIEDAAQAAAAAAGRGEDLRLDVADATPAMGEEPLALVTRELVENAAKFSLPGTLVKVSARAEQGALALCVADAGRGMSAEEIAAVAPFVQFRRDRHEQPGLGVGLSTARRLVELHRGSLSVTSELGTGTTVTARVPLA
jgi:signal transduction histidine kinase